MYMYLFQVLIGTPNIVSFVFCLSDNQSCYLVLRHLWIHSPHPRSKQFYYFVVEFYYQQGISPTPSRENQAYEAVTGVMGYGH